MAITRLHDRQIPRAIIHKRILDAAEARQNATIEELATAVRGAPADLVERVLDNYGDPVRDPPAEPLDEGVTDTQPPSQPVGGDLTEKQRETLWHIYEHPTASQRDIAALIGVSHTTVYHRLRSIESFEWEDRWAFVTALFDDMDHDCRITIDRALEWIQQNTNQAGKPSNPPRSVFEDPGLIQKVIHACIDADDLTDDDIHLIVEDFLPRLVTAHDMDGNERALVAWLS